MCSCHAQASTSYRTDSRAQVRSDKRRMGRSSLLRISIAILMPFCFTASSLEAKSGEPGATAMSDSDSRAPIQRQARPSYRVGRIEILGSGHLTDTVVIHLCAISPGALLDDQSIEGCAERLKERYRADGFMKAQVDIRPAYKEPKGDAKEGIVDIVVRIDEGARYFIGRIEFKGNEKTRHRRAQRAAGIQLGSPYDPGQIRKWVQALNRLGKFKTVTNEDVHIETDEREHSVHVLFNVREK
jgi:outer membrane protein assembly factor BamA